MSIHQLSFRHLCLASTVLVATPAFAQTTEPSQVDEIVVTGAWLQARNEIATKREATIILDSISADEIGSLPDFGLGEALERVPGVSTVQNNDRGEAQFLSIRGLNADYNLVEVDGVALPANELNRRNVSLDVIPSSLARRVDVAKSVTPAMNANAIGGVANLVTRSAFDGGGGLFVGGRFDIGQWDAERQFTKGGTSGQGEIVLSNTFGPDDRFGFVVSASRYTRDSASLNSAVDNYSFFDPVTHARLAVTAPDLDKADIAPQRRRWLAYDNIRKREGVFGKLEYRHGLLEARLTAADFTHTNEEDRQSNILVANGNPVTSSITATRGSVASANAQVDLSEFDQERGIRYVDFRVRWTPGERQFLDFGLNAAVATYRQDTRLATYRIANTNSLAFTYEGARGDFPYLAPANPAFLLSPANYRQFEYGTALDDAREEANTAKLDWGFNVDGRDRGLGVQLGAYARRLDRNYDRGVDNYRPLAVNDYRLSSVGSLSDYAPYNGRGTQMLIVDPRLAQAFFEANRAGFSATSTNAAGSVSADYDVSEDIDAAYAMGRFATDRLTVVGGLRYERTQLETGSAALISGAYVYGTQSSEYDDWLPSLQANYDLTDRLKLRAAFSRTIGRPNYDVLAAREIVSVDSDGDFTIRGGNPNLRPRRSDNADLSVEYYAGRDAMVSVGVFQKDIADEILTLQTTSDEMFNGALESVTRIRPANAGDATVRGLEFNLVLSRMSFLPGPLEGLGFSANLTLLDATPPSITMDDFTQRRLPGLFESSDRVGNLKVFYTAGPLTLQGAWNHVGDMLYSVSSSDPLQDRIVEANDRFDAQARYRLNANLTVVAQAKNLTNEKRRRMFGPDFGLLREELDNGRAFYIGALFKY
ncbi:TonB-dependent receptor [Brevundimonas sp.]|uniref:TonB-dependent receptor n=1 Tax=Brevundimonas sp. TaxID=1871086 RepID=UPI003D1261E3